MKRTFATLALWPLVLTIGCKPGQTASTGPVSGLYTLNVSAGSVLSGDAALTELDKFCGRGALDAYLGRVAGGFSFNAGYAEHPDAGYDASIVRKVGPDGVEGYYIGEGQMYSGSGFAMYPPTNGSITRLVQGYCSVVINSLRNAGGGIRSQTTSNGICAYPQIEVSQGGSVSGSSASGSINSSNCLIARMANSSLRNTAEVAFCGDSFNANFQTQSDGAAGEMSFILQGSGRQL